MERISFALPDVSGAESANHYFHLVQKAVQDQTGQQVAVETIGSLWKMARDVIKNMGDVFWDADEYESCGYCHLQDEGCSYSRKGNPVDPGKCCVWYGSSPSERMLAKAAATVLEALLAVKLEPQERKPCL